MTTLYDSIIKHEYDDWEEFLTKLTVIEIFKDLINEYPDKEVFKSVIRFILAAYSVESDMIIFGDDWKANKERIFETLFIQPIASLRDDLILLKNPVVVKTIQNWLDFQDKDIFTQIQMLKDLRLEMQQSCLTPIKKSSGEVDYDQKFKNAEYAVELKNKIKALELELIQNNAVLKGPIKDFRQSKLKDTIGPQSFAK